MLVYFADNFVKFYAEGDCQTLLKGHEGKKPRGEELHIITEPQSVHFPDLGKKKLDFCEHG